MSIIRQRKQKIRHFREPKVGDRYLDAVSRGDVEAIQDYISRRGNPHYADCKGQTALHIAVRHQQHSMLENLVPFFDKEHMDQRDMFGLSAYKVAEQLDDKKAMRIMNNYMDMLYMSPYKNYSFKKPAKRGTKRSTKKASIKNNAQHEDMGWNMMYVPVKGPSVSRSPIVYHSANKKVVAIQNKKKTRKTRMMPTIVQQNKQ